MGMNDKEVWLCPECFQINPKGERRCKCGNLEDDGVAMLRTYGGYYKIIKKEDSANPLTAHGSDNL